MVKTKARPKSSRTKVIKERAPTYEEMMAAFERNKEYLKTHPLDDD